MPLDADLGKKMLQLITSRYDDRHWRKKIEKTLSLPQSGVGDPAQQQIFMYLKIGLKALQIPSGRPGFLDSRRVCHERSHRTSEVPASAGRSRHHEG